MLGAVREALRQEEEILYEEEWQGFATNWSKKRYYFTMFWWLI